MANVFLEQNRHMSDENIITELSDEEVFDFLSSVKLGRLVVRSGEDIDIYPVLFEVDSFDESDATSVVIRGRAHRLTSTAEINEADKLELKPWLPTLKYNYVRVVPDSVSGRHFKLGDEPDRYMSTKY